jgi:hypothetical protein
LAQCDADLQELAAEVAALQAELREGTGSTVSVQSVKRSQKIESLSKRVRKGLKLNQ